VRRRRASEGEKRRAECEKNMHSPNNLHPNWKKVDQQQDLMMPRRGQNNLNTVRKIRSAID
jgi:hypothetical protein